MNEKQVKELFIQIMHIGNKFSPSLKPFRIVRPRTIDEMVPLLDSFEYKRFKHHCPSLAKGIEDYLKYGGNTE